MRLHPNRLVSPIVVAVMTASMLSLAAGLAGAWAQEATPWGTPPALEALDVTATNADGEAIGVFSFHQEEGIPAVRVTGDVDDMEAGEYPVYIHETGVCDAASDSPFTSAGDPLRGSDSLAGATPAAGTPVSTENVGSIGLLGTITVSEEGRGTLDVATTQVSLEPGATNSLIDEDGSALVIHAHSADVEAGDAGSRLACGVIFPPADGTPIAAEADHNRR